ncbi:MAG: hypothetical protein AAFZ63_18735 [Bacteroidota bacterium]
MNFDPLFKRISFLLFTLFTLHSLSAQDMAAAVDIVGPTQDSVIINVLNLPEQITPVSFSKVEPSYRYFYIYGDGDFGFFEGITDQKHSATHRYPFEFGTPTATPYHARAYGIGIYSNGDRPPRPTKTNLINSPSDPSLGGTIENTAIIEQDSFLKLLPHAQAKIGEPLIFVIAVTNTLTEPINNAQLLLLLESEVEEIVTSQKGLSVVNPTGTYSKFPIKEVLVHSNNVGKRVKLYESSVLPQTKNEFQRILAFDVNDLLPNQEQHVFLELQVDSLMFNAFNGKNKGRVKFTAVLHTQDENLLQVNLLSNEQATYLSNLGLGASLGRMSQIAPDSVYNYVALNDSTEISDSGDNGEITAVGNYLAMTTNNISLVKEHDPNFLKAVGCECAPQGEPNKLLVTLHAENDGQGEVYDVYFDMELPAGLTASDIIGEPLAHHPFREDDTVSSKDSITYTILDPQNVRWHMRSQFIESIVKYGPDDPRTYAEIQFELSTDMPLQSLDSLLITCVRFNNLANAPVCTYPVPVSLIQEANGDLAEVLTCVECPEDNGTSSSWPWWYWLLLILLILLLILLVVFLLRR